MRNKVRSFWIEAQLLYHTHRANRIQQRLRHSLERQKDGGKLKRQFQSFLAAVRKQERCNVALHRQANKKILSVTRPMEGLEITRFAQSQLTQYDIAVVTTHHECGDWGDVSPSLWLQNNSNRLEGKGRILSVHTTASQKRVLIVSEEGQACLMMEEEYPCWNSLYPA